MSGCLNHLDALLDLDPWIALELTQAQFEELVDTDDRPRVRARIERIIEDRIVDWP